MHPVERRRGAYLPHWTRQEAAYAITFRLADSLPQSTLRQWKRELGLLLPAREKASQRPNPTEEARLTFLLSQRVQQHLDNGAGACYLRNPLAALILHNALACFQDIRYWIRAWCIMPNHVHVLVTPKPGFLLPKIVQGWKSFSAREIAREIPIVKPLWQTEYYDHIIRDGQDYHHAIGYILKNPSRAGLRNWRWVGESISPAQPKANHGA